MIKLLMMTRLVICPDNLYQSRCNYPSSPPDEPYVVLRQTRVRRQTFFEDIRALTLPRDGLIERLNVQNENG